jgi:hypothetical protein
MAIEIRRLHPSEFDLLKGVDDGFMPDPARSIALVAQNTTRILGRLFLMAPSHVEGIWLDPDWRGSNLFRDMMNAMELEARSEGISKLFAYSTRPEICHYLERRCDYAKLPWTVLAKELPCRHS